MQIGGKGSVLGLSIAAAPGTEGFYLAIELKHVDGSLAYSHSSFYNELPTALDQAVEYLSALAVVSNLALGFWRRSLSNNF